MFNSHSIRHLALRADIGYIVRYAFVSINQPIIRNRNVTQYI
ncbi:MAG: hypothetical protein WCX28_11925 [Bacteriovoracaceae bacterium]